MDLSRWGLQRFTRISDRYRNFREFLGEVLEGERSLLSEEVAAEKAHAAENLFTPRSDIERLLEVPIPSRGLQSLRTETIFEMLAPFFAAGFLLELPEANEDAKLKSGEVSMTSCPMLKGMFLFGRVFVPPGGEKMAVAIVLPDLSGGGVVRGRVSPVLHALNLQGVEELSDAAVFAFQPHKNHVFLIVCSRPSLWQADMIQAMHRVVGTLFERTSKSSLRERLSPWKGRTK